jgi:hypothetical protein
MCLLFVELISNMGAKLLTAELSLISLATKVVYNRDTELLISLIFSCFSFNVRRIEMCFT